MATVGQRITLTTVQQAGGSFNYTVPANSEATIYQLNSSSGGANVSIGPTTIFSTGGNVTFVSYSNLPEAAQTRLPVVVPQGTVFAINNCTIYMVVKTYS